MLFDTFLKPLRSRLGGVAEASLKPWDRSLPQYVSVALSCSVLPENCTCAIRVRTVTAPLRWPPRTFFVVACALRRSRPWPIMGTRTLMSEGFCCLVLWVTQMGHLSVTPQGEVQRAV